MTTDRARKRAARARKLATGEPYVLARRRIGPSGDGGAGSGLAPDIQPLRPEGPRSARDTHLGLVQEFTRRGWPLEAEGRVVDGAWLAYPGPARIAVIRASRNGGSSGEQDPDDEEEFDLSESLEVHVSAPLALAGRPGEVDTMLPADAGAPGTADAVGRLLGRARTAGVAAARADAACAICGDAYPGDHLLAPAEGDPGVCPACVFDGDLVEPPDVAYLAYQLDRLLCDDLAAPAGWTGVGAVLAALGGEGLATELGRAWRAAGTFFTPMPFWEGPGQWWTWVGASKGPLRALRPGTSAGHLAKTADRANPQRRRQVERDFRARTGRRLSVELWTAAVAYVVSFDTQARERPTHRPPWHALESFDATPDSWDVEGEVVQAAVDVVRKGFASSLGLGWDDYLGTDDQPHRRGLAAAHRFADMCEANGWESVRLDDEDADEGQAISVYVASHIGAYCMMASWHEDDDGRSRFAGAVFHKHDRPEPMALTTLREAKRFVELYGHGTDVSHHPYVPERDGSLEQWRRHRS